MRNITYSCGVLKDKQVQWRSLFTETKVLGLYIMTISGTFAT